MANEEHLAILKRAIGPGLPIEIWNQWRKEHPGIQPDLSRAILNEACLNKADLSYANLSEARLERVNLSLSNLFKADLRRAEISQAHLGFAHLIGADLSGVILVKSDLSYANLRGANLSGAILMEADLSNTRLEGANLSGADLSKARLIETNLTEATLTDCKIYGISAWNVKLEGAIQNNLLINATYEPIVTVDNLEVAQFIYLLLNNPKIRDVIDTIARKAVLILGRFAPKRKAVLDALREALRTHGYVPILFDFDKSSSRDLTETVNTLAHLSRFIIADLTDPNSIPLELQAIIPALAVPVQPILLAGKREFSMFVDLRKYPWVLPTYFYTDQNTLLSTLKAKVIEPAEQKVQELEKRLHFTC